jgi:hypothetical protein
MQSLCPFLSKGFPQRYDFFLILINPFVDLGNPIVGIEPLKQKIE